MRREESPDHCRIYAEKSFIQGCLVSGHYGMGFFFLSGDGAAVKIIWSSLIGGECLGTGYPGAHY